MPYLSPEQAGGKPLDARSDLYSLGAVLYEMVTGRPPFVAGSPAAVMLQHVAEPVPPPGQFVPTLPAPVQDVLQKALAKDPAARYPGARDLFRALAAAVRGEPPPPAAGQPPVGTPPLWLRPLAGAAEVVAPLIGRQAPLVREPPRDRRGLLATVLGLLGILLTAFQFISGAFDLVSRSIGRILLVLPYWIAALLCAGAGLSLYRAVRPRSATERKQAVAFFSVLVLVGAAWGGWTLYERMRPPDGIVIAIGDFEARSSRQVDFARRIYEQLNAEVGDPGARVILQRTFRSYADDAAARADGAENKASVVIWGWYDDAGVSPHVELLRIPSLSQESSVLSLFVSTASAATAGAARPGWSLRDVAHYVRRPVSMPDFDVFIKNGPQQMAYVSTMLLGLIYYANGDDDHALSFLDKAVADAPAGGADIIGQEVAFFQRSTVFYQQGRFDEARTDLEQALSIKPDFYEAHYNLGILYASTCDPAWQLDRAVAEAEAAIRLRPDNASAHQLLGDLYRQAGRYPEAVAELEAAARYDPAGAQIQQLLAGAYEAIGKTDLAQTARTRAIALLQAQASAVASGKQVSADPAGPHLDLGDAYLGAGKIDEALAEYQAAQRLAPSDPRISRGLGNAYYWQGKPADAEREYLRWVTLAPQDATGHLLLGMLYREEKKNDEALPELQKAADLAGCSTAEHMVLAGTYYDRGDYAQAVAEYQAVTRIDPHNADGFYLLGVTQLLQAENSATASAGFATPQASPQIGEAAQALETAVSLRPDFAQAYFALGSAYSDQGQYERAAVAWESAVRYDPAGGQLLRVRSGRLLASRALGRCRSGLSEGAGPARGCHHACVPGRGLCEAGQR